VTTSPRTTRSDALIRFGYRLVSKLARITPSFIVNGITAVLVPIISVTIRTRRSTVARHMQRVQPELRGRALRRTVQKSFESYAHYYIETFRLPSLNPKTIQAGFTVEGFEHIKHGLELGKGVILALPHLGGWEWSGRWLIQQGHRLNAVVEKLDSPGMFEMFMDLRKSYGVNVIPLDDHAGIAVQRALGANEIVALLSDRDIQRTGIEVKFFSECTTIPAGPAFFALRTGAALLPAATYFSPRGDGHETLIRPALVVQRLGTLRQDMARISQDLANELEVLIRHAPQQWHMFQPNWPSDPGFEN